MKYIITFFLLSCSVISSALDCVDASSSILTMNKINIRYRLDSNGETADILLQMPVSETIKNTVWLRYENDQLLFEIPVEKKIVPNFNLELYDFKISKGMLNSVQLNIGFSVNKTRSSLCVRLKNQWME